MDKKKIRVPYAQAVYGKREIAAVNRVLRDPCRIAPGHAVKAFEKKIAHLFGKKYGVMVNSGSSANLLTLEVLNLPKGSEVITPALTFSTTVAPLLQKGLVPALVDVEPGTYQIDCNKIERMITKKTRALIIPLLIGNMPDLRRLRAIAKKYHLWFIEDSCDTIGGTFRGKPTGAYSDVSTTSFYASHIITAAGTGGMACFHDGRLAERVLVKSAWGRQSTLFGVYEQSEEIKRRFAGTLAGDRYDAKFIFSEIGYNMQSTEIAGAFGLTQLRRLEEFSRRRRSNVVHLKKFFKKYEHFFVLPQEEPRAQINWLAFPLTVRKGTPFSRFEITKFLEEHNIQTRPIFSGNLLRQPGFRSMHCRTAREGYPVADAIMRNGFLIGCHQALTPKHLAYLKATFRRYLGQFS